jgi:rod shape-determining protein MreD
VLQVTIVPMIAIGSVIPNLVIILVVSQTLRHGQLIGTIFGAFSGLVFDLISGGALGTAMFATTISAFIAGYFYNDNKIEYNTETMFFLLIVFISASIKSFFYLLFTASEIKLTASHLILEQAILPGVFTALIALPLLLYNQKEKSI